MSASRTGRTDIILNGFAVVFKFKKKIQTEFLASSPQPPSTHTHLSAHAFCCRLLLAPANKQIRGYVRHVCAIPTHANLERFSPQNVSVFFQKVLDASDSLYLIRVSRSPIVNMMFVYEIGCQLGTIQATQKRKEHKRRVGQQFMCCGGLCGADAWRTQRDFYSIFNFTNHTRFAAQKERTKNENATRSRVAGDADSGRLVYEMHARIVRTNWSAFSSSFFLFRSICNCHRNAMDGCALREHYGNWRMQKMRLLRRKGTLQNIVHAIYDNNNRREM